jgi:DNA-binding transcriptional ArsR family regulator
MLDTLFGNKTAERVLLYLANYGQGYARQIASTHGSPVSVVLKQLARLEEGGILVSRMLGRTRLYELNPRWFFYKELKALLEKALEALPAEDVKKYYRARQRPRRAGKPLWNK